MSPTRPASGMLWALINRMGGREAQRGRRRDEDSKGCDPAHVDTLLVTLPADPRRASPRMRQETTPRTTLEGGSSCDEGNWQEASWS